MSKPCGYITMNLIHTASAGHVYGFPENYEELLDKAAEIKEKNYPSIAIGVFGTIYPWFIIYCCIAPEERLRSPRWGLFEAKNGKWVPIFHDKYGIRTLEMMLEMKNTGGFLFLPRGRVVGKP